MIIVTYKQRFEYVDEHYIESTSIYENKSDLIVEYGRRNKKYVDTLYSYMGMFVNTDKSVIAYTDIPEPYEGDK